MEAKELKSEGPAQRGDTQLTGVDVGRKRAPEVREEKKAMTLGFSERGGVWRC